MTTGSPPSQNPADDGSLAGVLRLVLSKFLQGTDDMLPAVVLQYDRDTNRAQVRPLIKLLTTDGQQVGRAPVASVPVFLIGGGGYLLSFPVKPGDLGWIKASDRDISLFLQAYKESAPNTLRMHTFSDGLFFPDAMRDYVIAGEDADAVVLQSLDGTARVSLSPDRVKVDHPTLVEVVAPLVKLTATTSVEVDAPLVKLTAPLVEASANMTVAGNLAVTGAISWAAGAATGSAGGNLSTTGSVTADTDVISGTISLKTHTHSGVTVGAGNTGGPVP